MNKGLLAGRTVVITGGSMGIGFACAVECVQQGASVVICARGKSDLELAAAHFENDRVIVEQADVSCQADVERVMRAALELGGLDGVINAAGIYGPIGPVTMVDPEQWFDAIRINLFGTFLVARESARIMQDRGTHGSIVLMSGGGAATPFPNFTSYACGKVGVVRLAETMAQELEPYGIRVNAVAPGFVATRLHAQTLEAGESLAGPFVEKTRQQLADGGVSPTVAARTCAWLLSDKSTGITGRFIAAPYDGWASWPEHLDSIAGSDLFTLRRIIPKDRGGDWQ